MRSFFKRSKATLGIDVGSGFIKGVLIDHSGSDPVVTRIGYIPLVADAIVEGEIMDPSQVVDTIRSLMESMGVTSSNVVTAVGGRDVIVKKIPMDRMSQDDAREVIRWEAEQYVPFDMEGVQLDFQILDPYDDGVQMNVLLVAAKRDLVDQKVRLLKDSGIDATVVDVDAFALYNAFEYNYPEVADRSSIGLVNVGHELTTIIVVHEGVPVVTRDLPLGTRHMREDLRRRHGLSNDEAEAVLDGSSSRVDELSEILQDRGEELAMGLERAMAFLSSDHNSRGLGAVYLCGGGVRIPRLADAIARRLQVRVEVANPLQRLRVHPDAAASFPADQLSSMLMLPIGLALRGAA
ncbi:type IV pilus assembly protein PilM [soil metagenome]